MKVNVNAGLIFIAITSLLIALMTVFFKSTHVQKHNNHPMKHRVTELTPVSLQTNPTRGMENYRQLGVLIHNDNDKIFPLYGRRTYRGYHMWNYYTTTDGYHTIKLPISINNKDCTESYGCKEVYDGDVININGIGNVKIDLYSFNTIRYNPFV